MHKFVLVRLIKTAIHLYISPILFLYFHYFTSWGGRGRRFKSRSTCRSHSHIRPNNAGNLRFPALFCSNFASNLRFSVFRKSLTTYLTIDGNNQAFGIALFRIRRKPSLCLLRGNFGPYIIFYFGLPFNYVYAFSGWKIPAEKN